MVRCVLAILATVALASVAFADEHTYRRTEEQTKDLLARTRSSTERFRISLSQAIEGRGALPLDAAARANIYTYVRNLEEATSRLANRYSDDQTDPASAEQALRWSVAIDGFLWRHKLTPRLQADWQILRGDLKELADAYHVKWGWLGPIGYAHRRSEIEMKALINQMETRSDEFRKRLDEALNETRFNGTTGEDNVNRLVEDFEHATDRLKDEFNDADAAPLAVHDVLSKAARIDVFMRQHLLTSGAQSKWHELRGEINRLADAYHDSWAWY